MGELPITLCGSNCLVVGFGRIGKCLAKMLFGIGAKVHVAARKYSDLAWIKALGYEGLHTNAISKSAESYDLIINTVPHKVIDSSVISNVRNDTLIIDLASKPGGVEMDAATSKGLRVIWALSLPLKVTRWQIISLAANHYHRGIS